MELLAFASGLFAPLFLGHLFRSTLPHERAQQVEPPATRSALYLICSAVRRCANLLTEQDFAEISSKIPTSRPRARSAAPNGRIRALVFTTE